MNLKIRKERSDDDVRRVPMGFGKREPVKEPRIDEEKSVRGSSATTHQSWGRMRAR